jgi:leader peptidase (prepilin peptidase) / N-methyltransferase
MQNINTITIVALALFGLCLGSFAGASVWRIRARELKEEKKLGEKIDEDEYKSLKKIISPIAKDHSKCLHCGYELKWYDLLPLVSWVMLRGKCRKCRAKIGYFEPLMEIGLAIFYVSSYIFWPYELTSALGIARLIVWLVAGVFLAILFAYDKKWFTLPDFISYGLMILGLANFVMIAINSSDIFGLIINLLISLAILSGIYLAVYLFSKGRLIGFGDIKLGVGLALFLVDYKLAFAALFLANLIGCLVVLPGLITKKLTRTSKVPFGPFLIVGMTIAFLFGQKIIDYYISFLIF